MRFREWLYEATDVYGDPDYVPIYKRQGYNQKVAMGLQGEEDVRSKMQRCGWRVDPSSSYEDTRLGIDGYMIVKGQEPVPIQIKRKTKQDKFGFEWIKMGRTATGQMPSASVFLNHKADGKDATSQAVYYAVQNVAGTQITLLALQDAKTMINQAVSSWKAILADPKLQQYPQLARKYMNDFVSGGVLLKIIEDRNDNYWKMMAYIEPSAIKAVKVCNLGMAPGMARIA